MSLAISKSRTERSRKKARSGQAAPADGHHGWGIALIALALWAVVMALLHGGGTVTYSDLAPGQRAPATVTASADFDCIDLGRTELNRRAAADSIDPVFTINHRPLLAANRAIDKLIDWVARIRADEEEELTDALFDEAIGSVIDLLALDITPAQVAELLPGGQEDTVRDILHESIEEVWNAGIVSREEKATAFQGAAKTGRLQIRTKDGKAAVVTPIAHLPLPSQATRQAAARVRDALAPLGITLPSGVISTLVEPWMAPNLTYDRSATSDLRHTAERAVPDEITTVREGTVLVERGAVVTPQILEQLHAHAIRLSALETVTERRLKMLGNGIILLVALLLCGGLLQIVRPGILSSPSRVLLLAVLSMLTIAPARAILVLSTSTHLLPPGLVAFLLPLALAPVLAAVLIGSGAAVVLGLWTSFAAAVLFGNSFTVLTMGLIATIIAAQSARGIRKRSRMFRVGLRVGIGMLIFGMGLAALNQPAGAIVTYQAGACLLNGLVCAGLSLLLIPLFEVVFGITTDLRLLEYSDLGNPLLQRLSKEAPGTYHHSLMVADLARGAAAEIGGNELLVRVCAYFHDIGKLTKPEFFSENQLYRGNPHDELEPSMSTLIITGHVKEGVALARQHKLPEPIVHAIQQHHGTSVVSFFFHRACQKEDAGHGENRATKSSSVSDSDFRYQGPKPKSREMGILMLADSVEAASRSMVKPTANRIETLVNDIVDARIQDHQLDDSGLTLTELATVRRSLVFSLTSMLHGRIEYPKNENRNKPSSETVSGEPPGNQGPRPMDHATRATA